MEFSRQECWSGLPFSSLGDLSDPGTGPGLLWATREAQVNHGLGHQNDLGCVAVRSARHLPQWWVAEMVGVGRVWYLWLRQFWLDKLLCLCVPSFPHHRCSSKDVLVRILVINPCREPRTAHSAHQRQCALAVIDTSSLDLESLCCLPCLLAQCSYLSQLSWGICLYCDS